MREREWRRRSAPGAGAPSKLAFIGERAKRARHSQVCSIENRIYIYILLWYVQNFVLITRKEGGA